MYMNLLHPEVFDKAPLVGDIHATTLEQRAQEVADATQDKSDPDITVLVRTRNNEQRMESLFDDIEQQDFNGDIQVVVVDTESSDRTQDIARARGAAVIEMAQQTFTYPRSLNIGFEAAEHPYILTLTNRTNLVSKLALRSVTRWADSNNFAGAYGALVWDNESSLWEGSLAAGLNFKGKRLAPATPIPKWQGGAMVAHRSVVLKDAWQEVGGYDERFERGGEDTDFAKRLLAAGGVIVREPGMSVHHSHGKLSLLATIRQARELSSLRQGSPSEFSHAHLATYRADLGEQTI